jgi:hypothetical protein
MHTAKSNGSEGHSKSAPVEACRIRSFDFSLWRQTLMSNFFKLASVSFCGFLTKPDLRRKIDQGDDNGNSSYKLTDVAKHRSPFKKRHSSSDLHSDV